MTEESAGQPEVSAPEAPAEVAVTPEATEPSEAFVAPAAEASLPVETEPQVADEPRPQPKPAFVPAPAGLRAAPGPTSPRALCRTPAVSPRRRFGGDRGH